MYPFELWPDENQEYFIAHLEQLRATVERIKFNELVEASEGEKKQVIDEFYERRRTMIALIHQFEAERGEQDDEG